MKARANRLHQRISGTGAVAAVTQGSNLKFSTKAPAALERHRRRGVGSVRGGHMQFLRHNAEYWHSRAEEARAVAEMMTDPEAKRILLEIAESYARLAKGAAKRGDGQEV